MVPFKKMLLQLREAITEGLNHFELERMRRGGNGDSAESEHRSHAGQHMGDSASDEFDTRLVMELASKEQNIVKEIDWALKKIEDGTYGLCEHLGSPISKARLKAMPYVRLSIKAQEELERQKARGEV
ncbi:MAG: TraR/DksA C4-type zinc finger protein [Candidatus Omnitrophica bacterium]|nr:TraR/DksA C4-type zinc finger protein [Candidatus Omnitrophota bacterium]